MKKALTLAIVLVVVIFSNPTSPVHAQDDSPPIQLFNHGSEY